MTSRASSDLLNGLHALLAEEFEKRIRDGEPTLTKEGETVTLPCPASVLTAARQFLKDNHIESLPGSGGPLDKLAKVMSGLVEDDEDNAYTQ